jgi:hypothetical protein
MQGINDHLEQIHEHVKKLDCLPVLAEKVEQHEKFIASMKSWGLRILIGLACVALTGGAIGIKDLIKP